MNNANDLHLDIAKPSMGVEIETVSEVPDMPLKCPHSCWDEWLYRCTKHPSNEPLLICLTGSNTFTCPYLKKEEGAK